MFGHPEGALKLPVFSKERAAITPIFWPLQLPGIYSEYSNCTHTHCKHQDGNECTVKLLE